MTILEWMYSVLDNSAPGTKLSRRSAYLRCCWLKVAKQNSGADFITLHAHEPRAAGYILTKHPSPWAQHSIQGTASFHTHMCMPAVLLVLRCALVSFFCIWFQKIHSMAPAWASADLTPLYLLARWPCLLLCRLCLQRPCCDHQHCCQEW